MQKSAHLWRFACWKMFVFGLSGDFFFFHYAQYILQVCAVLSVAITVNLSVSSFHKLYHNCVGRGKQRTTGISAKCAFRHRLGSRNLSPTDTKCSRSLVFLTNLPQVLSYKTDSTSKWSVWINSFLSSTLKTLTQSLKTNLLMCYYNSLAHSNCGEQANYFQEIQKRQAPLQICQVSFQSLQGAHTGRWEKRKPNLAVWIELSEQPWSGCYGMYVRRKIRQRTQTRESEAWSTFRRHPNYATVNHTSPRWSSPPGFVLRISCVASVTGCFL